MTNFNQQKEMNQENLTPVGDDMTKLMLKVYLNVIFNWSSISQNQEVMNVLDIDTNTMCCHFKTQNPSLPDSYVQGLVLSFILMIWIVIATPIQTVFNEIDKLNRTICSLDLSTVHQNPENSPSLDVD
jgi:hypothetical protein